MAANICTNALRNQLQIFNSRCLRYMIKAFCFHMISLRLRHLGAYYRWLSFLPSTSLNKHTWNKNGCDSTESFSFPWSLDEGMEMFHLTYFQPFIS